MVSIDTVYQKVLMFANKEQRGYITPQEFNLFADQAQLEIFEQYFYDMNFYLLKPSNSKEYSDIRDNLNEKIAVFEATGTIVGGALSTLDDFYRLGTVSGTPLVTGGVAIELEEVQPNELLYMNNSSLAKPSDLRPVYVRTSATAIVTTPFFSSVNANYIKKPTKPNWSYVVVNGKAMYDSSNITNFELHPAEESELVYKILKFAGVSMRKDNIVQMAQGAESLQVQQEKQ